MSAISGAPTGKNVLFACRIRGTKRASARLTRIALGEARSIAWSET